MSSFDFGPIKKKEWPNKPVVKKDWANKPVVKKVTGEKTIISKTAKIKTPKVKPVIDIEDFRTPVAELNTFNSLNNTII